MDSCIGFCAGLFFLVVLVTVGHFVWVGVAALLRILSTAGDNGAATMLSDEPNALCARCRVRFAPYRQRCPECGLHRQSEEAAQLRDLEAVSSQIATLTRTGQLANEIGDMVLRAVAARRQELLEQLDARRELTGNEKPVSAHPTMPSSPSESIASAPSSVEWTAEEDEDIPLVLPVEPSVAEAIQQAPAVEVAVIEAPPPIPRRSFGEMMAAFMEERNILWGELVGGLLIVGCSIALVISLRQALEEIPYFPFLIVGTVTAALIGAGRYTLSHWKLESTSRGLLVIGALMVPLSFMVLAGLAGRHEQGALEAVTEMAAIALFTWLVRGAANILLRQPIGAVAPRPDWLGTAAILGSSASLLLVPYIEALSAWRASLLGLVGYVPAACFVITQALSWHGVYRQERISTRQAGGLFLGLGLSVYALGVAFLFLLFRAENVGLALESLAVPIALAGLPLLVGGTIASARLRGAGDVPTTDVEAGGLPHGVAGVIATMLTLGGTLVMLLALVAAWPNPMRLTVIAAVNAVVLSLVAHRFRLAPAYVPAQICLAVAVLTGWHLMAGHLDVMRTELGRQLMTAWFSSGSGVMLLLLAGLLMAAAEWQARGSRRVDSHHLGGGAGGLALASLLLVLGHSAESPGQAACVFSACAAGIWVANARWQLRWLTAFAAAVLFGGAFFALRWLEPALPVAQALVWSLLADAVGGLLLAVLVERWCGNAEEPDSQSIQRVFVTPLHWAALTASLAAACAVVPALRWDWMIGAALAAAGIGGVWLVLAWRQRLVGLFEAFQGLLIAAVVFGCVRALQTRPWFTSNAAGLLTDVRSWEFYGVGLSGLVLTWVVARFALRKSERAWALVDTAAFPVDRVLLHGLVVLLVLVTIAGVVPGVAEELTPRRLDAAPIMATSTILHIAEPCTWCWLGLLALALGLTLWQDRVARALPALTIVVLCAGATMAAEFDSSIAIASAVRWGLALFFVVFSALLWQRGRLARIAAVAGVHLDPLVTVASSVRVRLVAGAVLPVLFLTGIVAAIGFAHLQPTGPLTGTFFDRLGPVVNNLTPLVLLCIGLAGHGIRERSAGYVFAAGQVALVAVVGGYALGIITDGGDLGGRETVTLGQLATGVTAVWLLGWLALRHLLGPPAAQDGIVVSRRLPCAVMMRLQDVMILGSPSLWLLSALTMLAFPQFDTVDAAIIKMEAGSWLAWLVVGLAVAAGTIVRLDAVRTVPSWLVGLAAVLIGGVLSCTVSIYAPAWDQRVLMFVAAGLSLLFALTLVRWAKRNRPAWLVTAVDSLMELTLTFGAGGFAVILALERAATVNDHYWAAAAVAIVAVTAVLVAIWQRTEGWMFLGNVLALVAASLIVCRQYPGASSEAWSVLFVQMNLATAGVAGLVWLALRPRISGPEETQLLGHPWLCLQHILTGFGNAGLLGLGFAGIVVGVGESPDSFVLSLGRLSGWLGLAPPALGAVWLLRVLAPRRTLHALAGTGIMTGVLAACTSAHLDVGGGWLAYHVLTISWLLLAAGIPIAAWWGDWFPRDISIGWVLGLGGAVTALATGAYGDPYRPYWSCGVVLTVAVQYGALALWTQRREFVYGSGLLVNVVGHLAWRTWAEHLAATNVAFANLVIDYRLLVVHVTCLALASLSWSVIELGGRRLHWPVLVGKIPPFRHLAAWAALGLFAAAVGYPLLADWTGAPVSPPCDPLVWVAGTLILAAAVATLWDGLEQHWAGPWPQLYGLGLLAIGAALHLLGLTPAWLGWAVAAALGPYVLLTALVCHLARRHPEVGEILGMPRRQSGWPLAWFVPAQVVLGGVTVIVALWICLTFADFGPRLCGFMTVACLAGAGAVLTPHWQRLTTEWSSWTNWPDALCTDLRLPRSVTLLLAVLACSCLHIAFVAPDSVAPWLHRSVWLMAAMTWMSALYGLLLPRVLPADDNWAGWARLARRLAAPLGLAACGFLLLVLVQEFFLYDPARRRTPLAPAGVIVVILALAVLISGALTFALSPARDRLRLSERGRTLYVYAAEVLLVLLLIHLRLNVPDFFPAFVGRYWVFVVMAVAFLGVGLSEFCQRRGLRVLADPLQRTAMFLPVLPLLAFLVRPLRELRGTLDATVAGMQPWTRYLDRLPDNYHWHAAVWFLMGLLYLIVAITRRSSNLALVAAVLANFGLWVVFGQHDQLTILVHPQLWLIPIGLIVLASEQINRQRLESAQALALRYAGLLLIYLSSTADMFITGLGHNVELPIILAVLSVAGVLLGILLRIRAFLLLGVTFLFLVVFSQIWHAAVDRAQTWVWWASGIVLGAAILTLFALFEKRRNDVLKVLDDFKHWR